MNIQRYIDDLQNLLERARILQICMALEVAACTTKDLIKQGVNEEEITDAKRISFATRYQPWYTEALALIKQLLPDRADDFVGYYKPQRLRKEVDYGNYSIEDYLQSLTVTRGYDKTVVVDRRAAVPKFAQQVNIVKACSDRFTSSLYDIKLLVQADLYDNELDAAQGLLKHGYGRAAGALAGVVLEGHLAVVCERHGLKVAKKSPTIADYNELLKSSDVIDIPVWRNIQHLADIRNLCDHRKPTEPTPDQIQDLLDGVKKVMKTVF